MWIGIKTDTDTVLKRVSLVVSSIDEARKVAQQLKQDFEREHFPIDAIPLWVTVSFEL